MCERAIYTRHVLCVCMVPCSVPDNATAVCSQLNSGLPAAQRDAERGEEECKER